MTLINPKNKQIKKLIILTTYYLFACLLIYFWRPTYLISLLIVIGIPTIINFYWLKKDQRKKILIFSLTCLILFAPAMELATRLTNAWDVQSILPRIFNIIPLENMIFAFFNFLWVLSFYSYFYDQTNSQKLNSRFKYLIIIMFIFSLITFSFYFFINNWPGLSYLSAGLPMIIVITILTIKKPSLLKKTWPTTIFFAGIFFIYEIISLLIGSWWWPGEYFYTFTLFGQRFPLDDVIVWYFLSTPTLLLSFEYFADDFN